MLASRNYAAVVLFLLLFAVPAMPEDTEDTSVDLLLYLHEKTRDSEAIRLLPFYTYASDKRRKQEEFYLWPVLVGYEIKQPVLSEELPFASTFNWYSFPALAMEGSKISILESAQSRTFISFALMTFFHEQTIAENYSARSWYSLPLFSFYNRETLYQPEVTIENISLGGLLFTFQDTYIDYENKRFPVYRWAIDPSFIILGEDGFSLAVQERWGQDHHFGFLAMNSFAFFRISATFDHYPGEIYNHFVKFDTDLKTGMKKLFHYRGEGVAPQAKRFPTTRVGLLDPIIAFESNPSGYFSWQFLPFFHYETSTEGFEFSFLPLGIAFDNNGVKFSPKAKFFPFMYYNQAYGSLDILWPLFRYVEDPVLPRMRFTVRFLFDYHMHRDSAGHLHQNMSAAEGLLFSFLQNQNEKHLEILPLGFLFSYSQGDDKFQWRLLGFGYEESPRVKYLHLPLLRITLGNKALE